MVVTGGPLEGEFGGGCFVRPSLMAVENLDSYFIQEEIFGPIICLEKFSTEEEAIHRANATRYGLAASVWTNDLNRSMRVSRAIKSGTVWLNTHGKLIAEAETGGYGESGLGRLHGTEALNDFMETKHIYMEISGD
jgi:acyl-CoA reductase-like NAD-dependent aldehyde dehydrogenase